MIRFLLALSVLCGVIVHGAAAQQPSSHEQQRSEGFSVSRDVGQITIHYDGKLVSRYHFGDKEARKPYLWPVIGPTGKSSRHLVWSSRRGR